MHDPDPQIRPMKVLAAREAIDRGAYGPDSPEEGIAFRNMVRTATRARRVPPPRPLWDEWW